MNPVLKRITLRGLLLAALMVSLVLQPFTPSPAYAATTLPVLWTAGGLSAGNDSAGQAARMAVDASGNVAIVSGPSLGRDLAVTSYTATGTFRWRKSVAPASGTFVGNWVVAAPNGDFVALGSQIDSRGRTSAVTLVRYASNGTLQWRVDSTGTVLSLGRLLVDAGGNAYFRYNSTMYKYSPSGTLLWSVNTSVPDGAGAFSPDGADLVLTGSPPGGASWVTAVFDTATGARRWLVSAPEGNAAIDVLADSSRVYVAGQGVTGAGTPAIAYFMTVVAYDRATGARLWRTDKKPADGASAAGLWMARAPDDSFVVTGQASRGFLDWYTVAFETTGAVRWEAVRDGGLNTDEIPRSVFVLADGTTVVTGPGGPNLPGGYIQGVTAGYSSTGTLLWEAFSPLATVWAAALPSGDVCATGGYDALITCFRVSGGFTSLEPTAVMSATPSTGTAPLTVAFDGSGSIPRGNPLVSWTWSFGDGSSGSGVQTSHVYLTPGSYTASLTVTDSLGVTSIPATTSIVVSVAPPTPTPTITPAPGTNTGFLSPSTNAAQTSNAGDNNGYQTSPANAYANDSSVATDTNSGTNTSTSCTNNGKDRHRYNNYNFNIPATAVIQGIQVRLDARADATGGSPKICVQLSWDGGTTWTTAKSTTTLSTTEVTYTLGSMSDTWGRTWTPGNFSNANFRIRVIDVAGNTNRDFFLDYVAVNVTYQP